MTILDIDYKSHKHFLGILASSNLSLWFPFLLHKAVRLTPWWVSWESKLDLMLPEMVNKLSRKMKNKIGKAVLNQQQSITGKKKLCKVSSSAEYRYLTVLSLWLNDGNPHLFPFSHVVKYSSSWNCKYMFMRIDVKRAIEIKIESVNIFDMELEY